MRPLSSIAGQARDACATARGDGASQPRHVTDSRFVWGLNACSGPKRYDYDPKHKVWFYARDGQLLRTLLSNELTPALGGGQPLEIDLGEEDDL